jgi:hypothetical protein
MLRKAKVAGVLLMASQAPCVAADGFHLSTMDTASVVETCRQVVDPLRMNCAGYIAGVFDVMVLSRSICPQGGSGLTAQVVAIALKYLNDHPEQWAEHPAKLIALSFKAAFPPCSTQP